VVVSYQQRFDLICLTEKMAVKSPFLGLGIAHIFCGLVTICTQIGILYLYNGDGYIGTGIWCGIAFITTGFLVQLSSESPSVLTYRKVMVILSMVFAIFLAFWSFTASLIHAGIDLFKDQYSHERSFRVTQGFCAIFEIVLTIVTLCQRTSDQEGQVLAQGPQTILTIQPGVQQGVQLQGVQSGVGYAPNTQVITYLQPQTSAHPQNFVGISTNPPPYSQPAQNQQNYTS